MARSAPARPPSYGNLGRVTDPAAVDVLKSLLDRLAAVEMQQATILSQGLYAVNGRPISAQGLRIGQLRDPKFGADAVNLQTLMRYVSNQLALAAERAAAAGGEGGLSNENGPIGGGSLPPLVPLADLFASVQTYADANPADFANHCITSGGSWAYMTGLIGYLQGIDPRVGGNGKRGDVGDPSIDALSYWHQDLPPVPGEKNVYVVDVIAGSCAPGARPAWQNVTTSAAAGAWMTTVP